MLGNVLPESHFAEFVDARGLPVGGVHGLEFMDDGHDSQTAWAMRTQAGQAQAYMATAINSIGPDKVYDVFSNWTDRIAKGELPFAQPQRPQGVERNVVVTLWDWAQPTEYLHDEIATDKRKPTVNAHGRLYGAPEESSAHVCWSPAATAATAAAARRSRDAIR